MGVITIKILNFGSCNIDYVYSLDHIVSVGETEATYKLETFPGGKGLNQSIAIARAGAAVYHAGCIGYDGDMLTSLLNENGVDTTFIKNVDVKNGHAIIQVSAKGENSIFLYGGSNETVSREFIDSVLENFSEGDLLVLQNEISNVLYIIEKAFEKKMRIMFNPSPTNEDIVKIDFGKLSYLILNEVEAAAITGRENPEDALTLLGERYPSLCIILTLGEKGCIYSDSERELYQNAFKADVVDTTAAGDTFTGYFAAGIYFGTSPAENIKTASAAASIAVSRSGAAPSIPTREETLKLLEGRLS